MLTGFAALTRRGLGRRLALTTVSSGSVWIAGTLATFAVGVVLARMLGPAGYGVYGSAMAIVVLLNVPAQLGLPLLATREVSVARTHGRVDEVAALAWWFVAAVAGAALLLAAALWLAAQALPLAPALRPALAVAAALLPALALSGLAAGLLRGDARVVTSQALDVLVRPLLFLAALALVAWWRPIGVTGALGAQAAAAGAIALLGLGLFFVRLPLVFDRRARRLRAWTAAALPMTLLDALRALDGSYGVLIAGAAASIADAGVFRVALSAAAFAAVPGSLQNIVVAPFIAAAHAAGERRRLARIVAGSTLFMTLAVAALTLAFAVAGRTAIVLAFGAAFEDAYWPLLILCLNQLLTAATGPTMTLLSMTGHERAVVRALAASVAAAALVAAVLTPFYGIVATAAATLVASAVRAAMLNRTTRRTLGLDPSILGAGVLRDVARRDL